MSALSEYHQAPIIKRLTSSAKRSLFDPVPRAAELEAKAEKAEHEAKQFRMVAQPVAALIRLQQAKVRREEATNLRQQAAAGTLEQAPKSRSKSPSPKSDSPERQRARRRYYSGSATLDDPVFKPLTDSEECKQRILRNIKDACPAERLHILKDEPFQHDSDRYYDWRLFVRYVRLWNDRVTLKQWLTAIHVLHPAIASKPVSFYLDILHSAGFYEVLDMKGKSTSDLVKECGFSYGIAKVFTYHVKESPRVWPYNSYMQRRLGVDHEGEIQWVTKLKAKLLRRPLPNVPEHWL